MNKLVLGIGIGLAGTFSLGAVAATQSLEEVVVVGTRHVAVTPVGKDSAGVPIAEISISYGVRSDDLDLASAAGAAEMEKRVNTTAQQACKEIATQRPVEHYTTSEEECVKTATDKAMVKVHALVKEAGKKPAK